jgi:Protein of unknown function (DUF3383)
MSVSPTVTSLNLSNVINITLSGLPSGAVVKNVNNLALFTNEAPTNADTYRAYIDAGSVATDYGTSSVTAAMASAVFSQNPNILSGGGQLIIIPLVAAVTATAGTATTVSIAANLANIIAVTNGYFKVTVNAVARNLTGLNFSGCATLMDIAQVLENAMVDCNVGVDSTTSPTKLVFKSKKFGTSSTVTLSAGTGSGTDLAVATLIIIAGATLTTGVNASGESIATAITRTSSVVSYCGVVTNLNMEDAVKTALATTIQALDMIYFEAWSDPSADITGAITTIKNATNYKTRCLLYSTSTTLATLAKAAYAGAALSVDFTGSNTTLTMNLKPLSGVTADYNINQTYYNNAATAGADLYVNYEGVPGVVSNGANLYFDQIYARTALKFALVVAGFNYLRQTNTKVPQTEDGMNGLKGAYRKVMTQFVNNGYFGLGLTWTSSQVFGSVADFYRNITDMGFYMYSAPIALQASSDRALRKAPLVQMAGKEAGALHSSNVLVTVAA